MLMEVEALVWGREGAIFNGLKESGHYKKIFNSFITAGHCPCTGNTHHMPACPNDDQSILGLQVGERAVSC